MSRKLNFEDDFTHYMEHFDPAGDWELYPTDRDELLSEIAGVIATALGIHAVPGDYTAYPGVTSSYIKNVADGIEYERKQRQLRKGE